MITIRHFYRHFYTVRTKQVDLDAFCSDSPPARAHSARLVVSAWAVAIFVLFCLIERLDQMFAHQKLNAWPIS